MPEETKARRAIHVVAGLLTEGGRICVTRRRAGTHQGGKWEFPGGKLEPAEAPLAGLKRELHEELGIEVTAARPFITLRHAYPDLDVLLEVWQVVRYGGTPHGRESQELRWAEIGRLDPGEFPDADRPVLRRLQLPPLYVISDVRRFGADGFAARLERALAAGARLIQLREPQMDEPSFCAYARKLVGLCRRFGARLLVNADPAWVSECEADGVHLNSRRLMALSGRPLGAQYRVGASCHDHAELRHAQALELDFVVLGPVQPTASHPGRSILGWERFAALCSSTALPVYAIGGMSAADLSQARLAGAHGLAMISGVWGRDDPEAAVQQVVGVNL